MKRDEKERPRMRPPRDAREKKEEDKLKPRSPLDLPPKYVPAGGFYFAEKLFDVSKQREGAKRTTLLIISGFV